MIQTHVSGFKEYPKIETLFERRPDFTVDPKKLKKSVLGTISTWDVTEKIDGTNIRVMLAANGEVQYGGRSDNAQVPGDLLMYLVNKLPANKLVASLWPDGPASVTLFGEGYGAGIQKIGKGYRPDKSFILFDVLVKGDRDWWLDYNDVRDIAEKLGIESVPYVGQMTLEQIVSFVRHPFHSFIGTAIAEGIVARPIETLFDKRGERIIIKLKTKDFGNVASSSADAK